MANPTAQVPTESIPFREEKVYWPLDPAKTADTYYNGEMMGMRLDTGYAFHFDDSTPMLFLGTKEGLLHRLQVDTPALDFKELIRRPKYLTMPLASGTAAIPTDIGKAAYAVDSGHVQLSTAGLTSSNYVGTVVDIGRSGSTAGTGGILSLTTTSTPACVVIAPPVGLLLAPGLAPNSVGEVPINGSSDGLEAAEWQQNQGAAPSAGSFSVFLATRPYRVKSFKAVFSTASTSGTATATKDTGTAAPGAGTALLTGTVSLAGTANTVVSGTLAASTATLTLAAGDRIALTLGGTLTNLAGAVIQIGLAPV